jgi:hypothetical protein
MAKGGLCRQGDKCGGGKLLVPPQATVFLNGLLMAVVGTVVAPHRYCEDYEDVWEDGSEIYKLGNSESHCAAIMVEGCKDVFAMGIAVCREGHR